MEKKEQISLDDRIENLEKVKEVIEYEIAELLQQKKNETDRHPIGFNIPEHDERKVRKTKQ